MTPVDYEVTRSEVKVTVPFNVKSGFESISVEGFHLGSPNFILYLIMTSS